MKLVKEKLNESEDSNNHIIKKMGRNMMAIHLE